MSGIQQLLLAGGGAAVPVDPYFYSVTSLLHGDGANGGQNNTFLDSSTNNFTITRNGNTTQGSFSPFSQTGWSNYFDGSSLLTFASSANYVPGSGEFCLECWFMPTSTGTDRWLIGNRNNNYVPFAIVYTGSTAPTALLFYMSSDNVTWNVINGGFAYGVTANQWNHLALVRSGTSIIAYINGIGTTLATSSANFSTAQPFYVGGSPAAGDPEFVGYISNVRFVKGSTPYSGSTITVPTTPLTAITNTQLLTSQSNRFLDNSTNAVTPSITGSPSVQPFSPFNPTTAYSTSAIGGSGYFDGSGDYLAITSGLTNQFDPGSAYTFEGWFYIRDTADEAPFYVGGSTVDWNASTGVLYQFYISSGTIYWQFNSGGAPVSISGTAPAKDQWVHVAVGYNGTTTRFWVNGVSIGTSTSSYTVPTYTAVSIGAQRNGGAAYTGYASNLRFVKGTDVYGVGNTTITVPTALVTAISGTSLLTNFTNGAIFDNAAVADYETVGNAQISTSVKKYGTGSMSFDGTGDYLLTDAPTVQDFTFGTGDFTIECWIYRLASGVQHDIVAFNPTSTNGLYPALYISTANALMYYTNSADRITGGTIAINTWYHIALCRVAGQTKLFINGTQTGSTYADTNSYLCGASRPLIGSAGYTPTGTFNGYIDDFRISKGIGRYPYNFTPPTAEFPNIGGTVTLTADPYFDYTTLLLPGNGTNGAQNNTFLDSSTNAFSITRNGNTTQGTFSPFSQTGWGNYFGSAAGQYIRVGSSANLTLGSGAFTCECWVYPTAFTTLYAALWDFRNGPNFQAAAPLIWIGTDGKVNYQNASIASSSALALNQWTHVAIVRNGTTVTMYFNGTSVGSVTDSTTMTNTFCAIGAVNDVPATYYVTGYISNSRVVVGTAVYTSNFTPPTSPLTAITNTQLLTCQSNRFIDNSSNNFAITVSGSPSVQAFSPFNPTAAWSAATNGGSGYFDGSGDALYAPANAAFNFGAPSGNTNDFTVEMWVYPLNFSNIYFLYGTGPSGGSDQFYLNTDGKAYYFDGSSQVSSPVLTANSWNHLALVRNGSGSNNIRVYGNGVSGTAVTSSNSLGSSVNSPYIGMRSDGSYPLPGYISSLRVVKGTAVYTTTFTPPTAPVTAISGTSLLTNFTNAGIYDATSKNDLETVGNAQISTTQSKFGGSSMYFDGSGDYLASASSPLLALGTGDLTVEFWFRASSVGSNQRIVQNTVGAFDSTSYILRINGSSKLEVAFAYPDVSASSSTTIANNTWYHVALVRYGTSVRVFLNGIQEMSGTSSGNMSNQYAYVGGYYTVGNTEYFTGYVQDVRITKGIARYTSNFTPPTTAFLTL